MDSSVELNSIPYTISYQQVDGSWADTQDKSGKKADAEVIRKAREQYASKEDMEGLATGYPQDETAEELEAQNGETDAENMPENGTGAVNSYTKLKLSMQSPGEWTTLNDVSFDLNILAKGASAAYDIYNFGMARNELINEIRQSPNIKDKDTAIKRANALYNDQVSYTLFAAVLPPAVKAIGITGTVGIGFSALIGLIGVTASYFWDSRTALAKEQTIQIRWGIDPSGYVYEAVRENRLKDVKASVYNKENLEEAQQFYGMPQNTSRKTRFIQMLMAITHGMCRKVTGKLYLKKTDMNQQKQIGFVFRHRGRMLMFQ
ncbi:MAG: type I CRISPR-associated protein Cas7 [Coprococcus sp.]|nr:type I CRISPR-associated protein Cas7 [Coprococcus sp.]